LKLFILLFSNIICRRGNASGRWRHPRVQTDAWTKTVFFASAARRKQTHVDTDLRRPVGDALNLNLGCECVTADTAADAVGTARVRVMFRGPTYQCPVPASPSPHKVLAGGVDVSFALR
jgi:hypothetical protein